jgi:hypothetical protein
VITLVIMLYVVANGTVVLSIFNTQGESVSKSYNKSLTGSPTKQQGGADKSKELNAILTGQDTKGTSGAKPGDVEAGAGAGSSGSNSAESGEA